MNDKPAPRPMPGREGPPHEPYEGFYDCIIMLIIMLVGLLVYLAQ